MPAAETAASVQIDRLYHQHHGWLEHWLRRQLGHDLDAADLAHDTFVRLLASRRAAFGAEPRALLTHIAKGLVVDLWRRRDVERAYLDAIAHWPAAHVPSPESRLLIIETLCAVHAMIVAMPKRTQRIFMMAQLDGLGYARIAGELGLSVPTVKRHMRQAFIVCLQAL